MTRSFGAYRDLCSLTALSLDAAQIRLAQLKHREAGLRENLASLIAERTAFATATQGPDDAAMAAGAAIRWHQWVDQRRASINRELLQLRIQIVEAEQTLRHVFGRDQAAQSLLRDQIRSRQVHKTRKAATNPP